LLYYKLQTAGAKESEYQYVNNKLSGLAKDYDSLGSIVRTTEYFDGKVNGLSILYHPNGKIKSLAHCKNDSAYGYEYEFSETGDTLRAIFIMDSATMERFQKNGYLMVGF
jgi:antitoxin component YwqK of YwqJK toxin-antitoxin module